jgi:hypothetical protein
MASQDEVEKNENKEEAAKKDCNCGGEEVYREEYVGEDGKRHVDIYYASANTGGGENGGSGTEGGGSGSGNNNGASQSQKQECPSCLNPSTVGNWFYTYCGPNNPKPNNGDYNYDLPPKNISDKQAYIHDKDYDEKVAVGGLDLVLNTSVIDADMKFVKNQLKIAGLYATQIKPIAPGVWVYTPLVDPVTNKPLTFGTAVNALIQGTGLFFATAPKILIDGFLSNGPPVISK